MYEGGNVLGAATVVGGVVGGIGAGSVLPAVLPATGGSDLIQTITISLVAAMITWALAYKLQSAKSRISQ